MIKLLALLIKYLIRLVTMLYTDIVFNSSLAQIEPLNCRYGGAEKFEEVIFILSDNMADEDQRSKVIIKLK